MTWAPVSSVLMGRAHQRRYRFTSKLGIMAVTLVISTGLRWLADPVVPIPIPFTFYLPAIVITTILCGSPWGYCCTAGSTFWIELPAADLHP